MQVAAIWDLEIFHFCPWGSMNVSARCTLLKFGENRFIPADTVNIFQNPTSKIQNPMAAAILDFAKICTLPPEIDIGWCQVHAFVIWLETRHPCGNYKHFSKSKMAVAAILDLEIFHFCPWGSIKVSAWCTLLKFGENRFIPADTVNIYQNQRSKIQNPMAAAILDFGKFVLCQRGSIKVSARCTLLKFGENRFTPAETNNIFQNPRWRPPPSWIFKQICTLPQGIDTG